MPQAFESFTRRLKGRCLILRIKGLLKKIYGAEFHGLNRSTDGPVRSEHDNTHLWPERPNVTEELEAAHFGHLNIDESNIIVPLLTSSDSVLAITRCIDLVAG